MTTLVQNLNNKAAIMWVNHLRAGPETLDGKIYKSLHDLLREAARELSPRVSTTTVVKLVEMNPNNTDELLKWIEFLSDPAQPDVVSIPRADLKYLLELVRGMT